MAPPRSLADRLRAIPAPAALALIAGASFVGIPFVAGMFGGGTTRAEAMPSSGTGRVSTGADGLPASLPASMPTYMPSLTGSASPAAYAAPAGVARMGYAAGASEGTGSAGGSGGSGSSGGGSSNTHHHQPKAADQVQAAPTGREHPHPGQRGLSDSRSARHATAAIIRSPHYPICSRSALGCERVK